MAILVYLLVVIAHMTILFNLRLLPVSHITEKLSYPQTEK